MSTVAVVAACGGGGGGSGTPAPVPGPPSISVCTPAFAPSPTPSPAPLPPGSTITIDGTARYESVPASVASGALDYAGATNRPIRGATVQLLGSGDAVLATTVTDAAGHYAFTTTNGQQLKIRVRAELKGNTPAGASWDMTVRDNTAQDSLYVLDSAAFTPTGHETRDLRAASGWDCRAYSGVRAAAPFSVLDVAYQGLQKVRSASPNIALPALQLFWSRNNVPSNGNLAEGQIGTSFYSFNNGHKLYLLGAENTDTDEYDIHVVEHEFGHYLQSAVSEDDSVGGPHGSNDKLDMRVAFSEGWGNAWSGIALGDPRYTDSLGSQQLDGFSFDVSNAPVANRGWYSEATAQYLIWSANSSANIGFAPIFSTLQALKTEPTLTSLYSFGAALKTAAPPGAATIDNLWQQQQIFGSGALGLGETNDGGLPIVLPVYKEHTAALGQDQNYCVQATSATGRNKLGNYAYIRFTASGPRTLTFALTTPGVQADPDILLVQSNGTRQVSESSDANVEMLTTTLSAGQHVIALNDFSLPANTTRCFNFKVQ